MEGNEKADLAQLARDPEWAVVPEFRTPASSGMYAI